jgi:cobalt/nickel transport system permease protein
MRKMHVPDGFLSPQVCLIGYGITGGAIWYSLSRINRETNRQEKIPKAALLTAAFFVTSSIYIPIPPTSIHLVLNGLMGIVLGYYAFPAILVGLLFQAIIFGHGGLSTLGINGVIMGLPAILAYYIFNLRHSFAKNNQFLTNIFAFVAGALSLGMAATMFTVLMVTTIPADIDVETEKIGIYVALVGYSIQMVIEGIFTVMLVSFLEKVKPELLEN